MERPLNWETVEPNDGHACEVWDDDDNCVVCGRHYEEDE